MKIRDLATIPNCAGYQFYGIDHNGGSFLCELAVNGLGCHYVRNAETKEPCYGLLSGWLPV